VYKSTNTLTQQFSASLK